ncbi:MAG: nucleotidyl transferase AbiEii/AbiGii toxin family protein [Solirubrobacterales bacterium]
MSDQTYDEILRRLVAADVRFVLIGGLALNAWGVIRGTKDIDVVVDRDPQNVRAVAEAAVAIGGQVQMSSSFVSSEPGIAGALASGDRVMITTDLGVLDVVGGLPGVPAFSKLAPRAVAVELAGVRVMVCSLEDLRAMKEAAGRPQDLVDLANLDAIESDDN